MKKTKIALLMLTSMVATYACAETPFEANLKKTLEPRLRAGVKIDSVKETPYGMYEVRVGSEIVYTDKTGTYLFLGNVIDTRTNRNLTADRVDEINKIKWSDLPLENAVKLVKGDGKRVMAIFEDPNCGYCKQFRKTSLKDIDNVTVYTFMYNILAEDSSVKSKNIWCAPDRNKAWDEWMVEGKPAPPAPVSCATPNDKVLALGQKLHVNGTPAIFFADGSRLAGAVDTKALESKFSTIK